MSDCLFCRIIAGEIPAKKVHEDEAFLAFEDISPQAPVHVLIIPKQHVSGLHELSPDEADLAGGAALVAAKIARERNLADRGYRVVVNSGKDGGQTVFHLHFHLLGGRSLSWPPG